ncbi:hypothetical protein Tco_1072106 [Tanacetum coccineum]
MKGIKKERAKSSKNQRVEGKKDKGATPTKAHILMIRQEESYTRENSSEDFIFERHGNYVSFSNKRQTAMQKMGIVVSTIHGAIKFHTAKGIKIVFSIHKSDKIKEGMKKVRETPLTSTKGVLSYTTAEEKVVINYRHPEQTVTIEKQLPEHFKKVARPSEVPIAAQQLVKKWELTKAGKLRKVKHQTWVANPVMVKKSDGGWRMCFDFTDINKACPKDCYPLTEIDWKIQMAEGNEDKTTFFAGEGVFCYRKMPFGLKNTGATYQTLVDKVFHDQIGRNLKAYVYDMVIKSTFEEDMLPDIKETF